MNLKGLFQLLMVFVQLEIFHDYMVSTVVYDKYITSHIGLLVQVIQITYFFQSKNDLIYLKQM